MVEDPEGPFVVCVPAEVPVLFDDNDRGVCVFCGRAVQFRPHIPRPCRLVCMGCFADRVEIGARIGITDQTAVEIVSIVGPIVGPK
jgi:hypothetical protein